jgi:signal transduction histidine kinase
VAVYSRDITDYQRQEIEIRSQAAIRSSTLDSISDGVVVADEQGQFVLFNRAARAILGTGPVDAGSEAWSAAYGLYLPDTVTPYPADELPLVRAGRGENVDDVQIYMRHERLPEGAWLSVSARPVLDADGARRGSVAAFRDVTEAKRAEEAILAEQQVKEQMLIAHDRDRQLMAYEIHDGLVQSVTAAKMHLEALRAQFHKNFPGGKDGFDLVLKLLRDSIDDGRRLISGLRPPAIDELGVIAAIEDLVREQAALGGPRVRFDHDVRFGRVQPIWETVLYRIVQEALVNVRRHSQAKTALVRIEQTEDIVRVAIEDDGVGFDPAKVPKSRYGLRGIRERARLLQGRADVDSLPGQGTVVRAELPIATAQTFGDPVE